MYRSKKFHAAFVIKKISIADADDKDGWFLHRKMSVKELGWSEELDTRYAESLVRGQGLENGKKGQIPGTKAVKGNPAKNLSDFVRGNLSLPLDQAEHRNFREGAGMAQYMCDRRGDITFPTKELIKVALSPQPETLYLRIRATSSW